MTSSRLRTYKRNIDQHVEEFWPYTWGHWRREFGFWHDGEGVTTWIGHRTFDMEDEIFRFELGTKAWLSFPYREKN